MHARVLEPEWLDELPPQDPRAVRSRADLRRVNWGMANARMLAKALQPGLAPGARIVELGLRAGGRSARRRPAAGWPLTRAPPPPLTLLFAARRVPPCRALHGRGPRRCHRRAAAGTRGARGDRRREERVPAPQGVRRVHRR